MTKQAFSDKQRKEWAMKFEIDEALNQNQGLLFDPNIDNSKTPIPRVVPEHQNIETGSKNVSNELREVSLAIPGYVNEKLKADGNPIAKQADRTALTRIKSGPDKGDVFTYQNKHTHCMDAIIHHYQPALIKHYEEWVLACVKNQLPIHTKWTKEVHITQLEFIFKIPSNFPNYKIKEIHNGIIHYKTTKPDLPDNLKKALFDALEGYIFENDSLICSENNVVKRYGINPGIILKMKGR